MAYVDKAKLMQRIETEAFRWGEEYDLSQIMGDIEDFPESDVVEVVRCGKCKHGEVSIMSKSKDGEEEMACYCNAKNKVTDLEYYCACGERRDT